MDQYIPYAGTVLGLLAAFAISIKASRNADIAKSEARADKARSDYVSLLEKRIVALEEGLRTAQETIKLVITERDYFRGETVRLGTRVAELETALRGGGPWKSS